MSTYGVLCPCRTSPTTLLGKKKEWFNCFICCFIGSHLYCNVGGHLRVNFQHYSVLIDIIKHCFLKVVKGKECNGWVKKHWHIKIQEFAEGKTTNHQQSCEYVWYSKNFIWNDLLEYVSSVISDFFLKKRYQVLGYTVFYICTHEAIWKPIVFRRP